MRLQSSEKAVLFVLGLIVLAASGAALYVWIGFLRFANKAGPSKWDVVQSKGSDCKFKDAQPISNGHDLIAILREADCDAPWAQGLSFYVVFVHRTNEPNRGENLVLQYVPADEGNEPDMPPTLTWRGATHLDIHISKAVDDVRVQKKSLDGVTLTYE